ncbi:MAG: UDP-N-acetylmuramoyl-L-alanine--D-glutamate ligase [Desulfovibrio sp.]|nr:MAG: UDP-N-acetylmuramoyl-L-alanine--D-glutamate ligase [Desulfovibrio sp.]
MMHERAKGRRLDGRMAVVVGAGRSGQAASRLLVELGASVRLVDRNPDSVRGEFRDWAESARVDLALGEHHGAQFSDADMVVMSPGAPVATFEPLFPANRDLDVMAETELAARYVMEPVIGITGTNGKTTTASLTAHMLRYSGRSVFLGGNIGTPLSEYVLKDDRVDVVVLELSSFQLMTCTTFRPWVGVLLNFSPDHLDYHSDLDEYWQSKLLLFANQHEDDLAVVHADLQQRFLDERPTPARTIFYRAKQRFAHFKLLGAHNQENMEAAYQACRFFGVTENEAQGAIRDFEPLDHRIAPVAEIDGVLYVNDSKATTVDALRVALKSFDRPVLLLAGGVYKGGDLADLTPLMQDKVRAVGLFGGAEDTFREAWNGDFDVTWDEHLHDAVKRLKAKAREGDVVLLSPATASFDQYSNYMARGRDFTRIVEELA